MIGLSVRGSRLPGLEQCHHCSSSFGTRGQRLDHTTRHNRTYDQQNVRPNAGLPDQIERRKPEYTCKQLMSSAEPSGDALNNPERAVFRGKMMHLYHVKVAAVGELDDCLRIEVPSMPGDVEMQPMLLEELRLERPYIGYRNKDGPVGRDETTRRGERIERIVQMLEHVPEGDQIERCFGIRGLFDITDSDSIAKPLSGAYGDGRGKFGAIHVPPAVSQRSQKGSIAAPHIKRTTRVRIDERPDACASKPPQHVLREPESFPGVGRFSIDI